MKKAALLALFAFGSIASAAKFEYQAVDYESKDKFMPVVTQMGLQGWELVGCPTTGASSYNAIISGGGSFIGYYGRSVYCIFKRELP